MSEISSATNNSVSFEEVKTNPDISIKCVTSFSDNHYTHPEEESIDIEIDNIYTDYPLVFFNASIVFYDTQTAQGCG